MICMIYMGACIYIYTHLWIIWKNITKSFKVVILGVGGRGEIMGNFLFLHSVFLQYFPMTIMYDIWNPEKATKIKI